VISFCPKSGLVRSTAGNVWTHSNSFTTLPISPRSAGYKLPGRTGVYTGTAWTRLNVFLVARSRNKPSTWRSKTYRSSIKSPFGFKWLNTLFGNRMIQVTKKRTLKHWNEYITHVYMYNGHMKTIFFHACVTTTIYICSTYLESKTVCIKVDLKLLRAIMSVWILLQTIYIFSSRNVLYFTLNNKLLLVRPGNLECITFKY